jgi:hypothetical protein
MDRKAERAKRRGEGRVGASGHGPEGIAMIAVLEGNDFAALGLAEVAPVLQGELEGDFDGG